MNTYSHFARRRESIRLTAETVELKVGHLDFAERAELLLLISDEIDARALFRADAHSAARLLPGSLDDGSLSTDVLRAVLATLRGLPTP